VDIPREPAHNADPKPRLPLTLDAELIIDIVNLKLRIKSMLVGMEHGGYIMVKIFEKDLMGRFRSDDVTKSPMIVGYTHDDIVYGFRTSVLDVVSSPAKLFFLKYPDKIDKLSVRKKLRHECEVEAQAMLGNDLVELLIIDISKEGCQCVIKTMGSGDDALYGMTQVDKSIGIMVHLPGTNGACNLQGVIRNIGKDVDKIRLGVMFENVPDEALGRIESFISNIP
jgi:hypothetical protein